MITFSRTHTQARWIAGAYKLVGLWSIPLLTIVTIVSMANVFTSGQFAQFPGISTAWAIIFSVAIDVNIVRLFVEAKLDKSWAAWWLGFGLCIVTGAALSIEGLEQSIGVVWTSQMIQTSITILVFCRVLLVILLMAREGAKLGTLLDTLPVEKIAPPMTSTEQEEQEKEPGREHATEAITERDTEPLQNVLEDDSEPEKEKDTEHTLPTFSRPVARPGGHKKHVQKIRGNGLLLIQQELQKNPHISTATICKNTGLSRSYVSSQRTKLQDMLVSA